MIGLDIFGGDFPPEEVLTAISEFDVAVIAPKPFPNVDGVTFIEAENVIGMNEDPLRAVRAKKQSTIAVGMELLRDGKIDALVSTGNTGALFAQAVHTLPLTPGIKRPGLLVMLPTKRGQVALLDVGANLIVTAKQLASFAALGIAHQKRLGMEKPKVGILNIGEEEYKGKKEQIEAYQLLEKKYGDDFIGNVEARDFFNGHVDVVVTDGFTGNVLLKTAEGMAGYIHSRLDDTNSPLIADLNIAEYPGAILAGVEKIVIKCHGSSNREAILSGIRGAQKLRKSQ